MSQARIELLRGMSLFGAISPESLALLIERANTVTASEGECFFREGETGTSLFVLEKGCVTVLKRWQGEDYVLRTLGAGNFFGEIALLDFMPRSASVVAEEDCVAMEINARDVLEVARRDLEQFTMIYMNIAREMGRRLREANELVFEGKVRYEDFARGYAFPT